MTALIDTVEALGASTDWLITANFILSTLLGMWMLRYRNLYRGSVRDQRHNEDLIENLAVGVYRASPDGRHISANQALARLHGYATGADMARAISDGDPADIYVEPGRRSTFFEILNRDGVVEEFVSECFRHKTRERIWIAETARMVRDPSGRPLFYEGSVRDVTATVHRLKLEEQFRKLTQNLPGGLFQLSGDSACAAGIDYLSEGFERLTGLPAEVHIEKQMLFRDIVHPDDRDCYYAAFRASFAALEPVDHEFRIVRPDGRIRWVRMTARPERTAGSTRWYGYVDDVSLRKNQALAIEEMAYVDPLTRLPNRRMFIDHIAQTIRNCRERQGWAALLFIDLDNFKGLNDTLGHDAGDALLVQVAERLRGAVRHDGLVARMGGDEFVVVLDAMASEAQATQEAITTANRFLAELSRGFQLGDTHHASSASIGIVQFDARAVSAADLLKRADLAMYQIKSAGRNGVALFDPVIMDAESERAALVAELRGMFDRSEMILHFQPQVDHSGRVIGAEALARWQHPRRGLLVPDRFIGLAEQSGFNDELTRTVVQRGLEALACWSREPAMRHLRLSLNVGVAAFSSPEFVPMVRDLVARHDVDPARLTIELTEHVMARDPERVAARMGELKELGVRLSLDDFGTGYSSLAYLKRLRFDELKIDGGFVSDIETSENDRALVKTILAMARTLGLKTVAEHVENVRQEAFLRAFGCDTLQGYLYSPALSADDFSALFAQEGTAANRLSA